MSKYLEDIENLDDVGTSSTIKQPLPDSAVVLEVSGEAPSITSADTPIFATEIIQDSVSYSAPQKVIVRTYRLRK